MKKITIIGAGLGGVAAGIELARKGFCVTILEKNSQAGGRLKTIREKGFTFDSGPTLLLMPNVLRSFFSRMGRKMEDYIQLVPIEPIYRVYQGKNKPIQISADKHKTKAAIEKISPADAKRYDDYLAKGKKYAELATEFFLDANVHHLTHFLNPKALGALLTIGFSKSYYGHVGEFFKNDQVRSTFSFQSIYVGASPTDIPAAYSLIQFVEVTQGVWSIPGGLGELMRTLEKMAKEEGVLIQYKRTVKQIKVQNNRTTGVELTDGFFVPADIVISNADLPFTYQHLLLDKKSPVQSRKLAYSCSSFMMYLGIKKKLKIGHHTFLLPENFLESMNELFHDKKMPKDPGIYLNCPTKTFPKMAPKGMDALYVLVPVPNLEGKIDWEKEKAAFRNRVLEKINRVLKLNITQKDIRVEKIVTPMDWKNGLNLVQGSTFGLSPTLFQSAFWRPQNRDLVIKNLYFVGASTHPGSGIPIVLYGAKNTVQRIVEEQSYH